MQGVQGVRTPFRPKVTFFRPKKKSAIFNVCPPVATPKKALGHCTPAQNKDFPQKRYSFISQNQTFSTEYKMLFCN
jgi:hypothetical protein